MAIHETLGALNSSPVTHMGTTELVVHPHTAEGVLLPEWMLHKTKVIDVRPYKEDERTNVGVFTYDRYTMNDGTAYDVREGKPFKQRTSVPVDSTTAWHTQVEGHNGLTDKELVAQGWHTRRISAEKFPDIGILNPLDVIRGIHRGLQVNLAYSAHNILEILEVSDSQNHDSLTQGVSMTAGESRGPMIEPGLNILGRLRDKPRIIAHADSIDPCVPEGAGPFEPIKLAKTMLSEAEAMARTALHVIKSPDRREYVSTLNFTPETLVPALLLVRGLLNGQTGEMAKLRPKDSPMHLEFMRRSFGNDREIFEEIYKSHPLVKISTRGGAHIDIPRTRRGIVRRHGLMIEQLLANGDDPFSIDFEKVYALPERHRARGLLKLVS